jgi:hypothetical protein
MRWKIAKSPGKAPPPQDVNHPPPAEMKYTEEAGVLVPDSAARWRARGNILANYIQRSNKEEECRKRINYSSTSQEHTPTHIHAKSFKNVKKFIAI